ncbi:hypothetical protein ElyMa_001936700 [Elysia marginata]|uniref:Uncharacterized protein n=1 Tax=Elysia marginata TaxID=1093978 RepID=A0AAV4EWR3_9GAST|nr:hypothetical protein ElyMa_001936700 [Elysia marginata]
MDSQDSLDGEELSSLRKMTSTLRTQSFMLSRKRSYAKSATDRKQVFSDLSSDPDECTPLAVLLHKQFQSKMGEKEVDEEPSTSYEAYSCHMHIMQDLIKDIVSHATGIAGNPELTRDDEITTIKRRPPKRVNKPKERKKSLNYGEEYITNRGKTVSARSLAREDVRTR